MLTVISMNKPTQQQTSKAKQLINKNDPTKLNRKKINNAMKELKSGRLLVKKIATQLELWKAKKNRHVICFQKGTSQKTQKDQW